MTTMLNMGIDAVFQGQHHTHSTSSIKDVIIKVAAAGLDGPEGPIESIHLGDYLQDGDSSH
jgi:hypothetical protein